MFFLHLIFSILQILAFTLTAGFVLGFLGQEFKLEKTLDAETSTKES